MCVCVCVCVCVCAFSDLKSRVNKYLVELWQPECDEFPENKLQQIVPVLKDCITCLQH